MRIEKHADVKEHELIEAKKRLRRSSTRVKKSKESCETACTKTCLQPGDEVKVLTFGTKRSFD